MSIRRWERTTLTRSIAAAASAAALIGLTACGPTSEPSGGESPASESSAAQTPQESSSAEESPQPTDGGSTDGGSTKGDAGDGGSKPDDSKQDDAPASDAPSSPAPSASRTAGGQQGGKNAGAAPNRHDNDPSLCDAADFKGSIQEIRGGAAAGSVYRGLVLTNTSDDTCILKGFPGVSFVNAAGAQIGAAADRNLSTPSPALEMQPGESAMATLQVTRAENYGPKCNVTQAAGLRVYPPSAYDSLIIEEQFSACASDGVALLTIGAFQPIQ